MVCCCSDRFPPSATPSVHEFLLFFAVSDELQTRIDGCIDATFSGDIEDSSRHGEMFTWALLVRGFMAYVFLRLSIRFVSWDLRILALKLLSHLFHATGKIPLLP
mgnify:CR=1 FL=1